MKQLVDKEIVIVAGPSASGKSHLLQQLMTKKTNTLKDTIYRELNIDPQKPRSCIAIGALAKLKKKPEHSKKLKKEIIFIHFDTTSRRQNKKRKIHYRKKATTTQYIASGLMPYPRVHHMHFVESSPEISPLSWSRGHDNDLFSVSLTFSYVLLKYCE